MVFKAESAGFHACLSKEVPSGILLETILSVGNMPFFTYPPIDREATERTEVECKLKAYNSLTQREKLVLKVLTSGNSSKECAEIRIHDITADIRWYISGLFPQWINELGLQEIVKNNFSSLFEKKGFDNIFRWVGIQIKGGEKNSVIPVNSRIYLQFPQVQ